MNRSEMLLHTCCFTGHRVLPEKDLSKIQSCLREKLRAAIRSGYYYFGAGGALGFDTLAAQTVLELREEYKHIRLILLLPCKTQTRHWKQADINEYERIKSAADKIVYISEEYTDDCMLRRNRHLVVSSSLCICYLTKRTGGTAYTVRFARKKGLQVWNIAGENGA